MRKFKVIICSADTLLQEDIQRDAMSCKFFHFDKLVYSWIKLINFLVWFFYLVWFNYLFKMKSHTFRESDFILRWLLPTEDIFLHGRPLVRTHRYIPGGEKNNRERESRNRWSDQLFFSLMFQRAVDATSPSAWDSARHPEPFS